MYKRYWKILQPFHKAFYWFLFLLVIYEGAQVAESYVMSLVIRLFTSHVTNMVWIGLLVTLILYDELFMRLDNAMDWHILSRHVYPLYKHLKIGALSKFLEMDIPWHQRQNSGALVGKVANGAEKVHDLLDGISWEFLPTLIQTFISLGPLIWFSRFTALLASVAFVVFISLTVQANRQRAPYRRHRHDLYEKEWHQSIETVQTIETSVMFGQQQRLLREQTDLHEEIITSGQTEARLSVFTYNRRRIRVLNITRRAILAMWIWQLTNHTMDIAGLFFVSTLTEKLFSSFWRFARLFDRASEASEGADRLATVHELTPAQSNNDSGFGLSSPGPIDIALEHVCFSFRQEYDKECGTLHDVTLSFPAGTITALVGPSGAGKTSFRKIITRSYPIQSGRIQVAGVDINDWNLKRLREIFSYVPQDPDIFADTIRANIAFSHPHATLDEVIRAAKLAGIHEFILTLSEEYNTKVGERGKRLSGGQMQRVALARAILADRPVLILDEATSAVDAITEREIQSNMREIVDGKTVIIIAHNLSTIWELADQIVLLNHGRVVEQGTHEQLIALNGLYAKMVAIQTYKA